MNEEKELAYQLLEILDSCRKILQEAIILWRKHDVYGTVKMLDSIEETLDSIRLFSEKKYGRESKIKLKDACTCCLASIKNVKELISNESEEVDWKLKKELVVHLDVTYLQYMYWSCVYGSQDSEDSDLLQKKISEASMFWNEERQSNIDLSIVIVGYNHLDYTKQAVESVLREIPDNINVELVLFNHGSSDGTLNYFNSIPNAHVYNVAINGVIPTPMSAIVSGRYVSFVSNDVVIGKKALKNMYKAITADDAIGWIVPSTCNVSNYQDIKIDYKNDEGYSEKIEQNNQYDQNRHEQRVRLCNPLDITPTDVFKRMHKEIYVELFCGDSLHSFPDDKVSLWMRRNGYKIILQKDAYCHHAGSITVSEDIVDIKKEFYRQGIIDFIKSFGINPWGKGSYYDDVFYDINFPSYKGEDNLLILGVNSGMGSNPLKIRENLKEQGAENLKLVNITDEKEYLQDLAGVSDEVYCLSSISDYVKEKHIKQIGCLVVEEYTKTLEETLEELVALGVLVKHFFYKISPSNWRYIVMN